MLTYLPPDNNLTDASPWSEQSGLQDAELTTPICPNRAILFSVCPTCASHLKLCYTSSHPFDSHAPSFPDAINMDDGPWIPGQVPAETISRMKECGASQSGMAIVLDACRNTYPFFCYLW